VFLILRASLLVSPLLPGRFVIWSCEENVAPLAF
jgi:hypothetical protein